MDAFAVAVGGVNDSVRSIADHIGVPDDIAAVALLHRRQLIRVIGHGHTEVRHTDITADHNVDADHIARFHGVALRYRREGDNRIRQHRRHRRGRGFRRRGGRRGGRCRLAAVDDRTAYKRIVRRVELRESAAVRRRQLGSGDRNRFLPVVILQNTEIQRKHTTARRRTVRSRGGKAEAHHAR